MVNLTKHRLLVALTGLVVASLISNTDGLAVMSIDLGNEFIKIAIVKPGVPMEIALNKESRRKSPLVVSMRNGERSFGDEALNTAVKFPKNAYRYLRELLGKTSDNPVVERFKKTFPYYNIVDDEERNTFVFQHDENTKYSPEELLAMILQYAKEQAEHFAEQKIPDAVIVTPAYFNQAERRALKRAAELAGINVLQLMNDHAATALNYGVFRRKTFNTTATHIMFYDMGSTSTTATIVGYQLVKTKDGGFAETNPQLTIKGVGFDKTLGGVEIQHRLQAHLAKLFNEQKKTPNNVLENPRAMAKLFKEAGRVKNVLSANIEHFAQIEGLLDDKDFKAKVTREELETMCADIFERVGKPVEDALKSSHMTMDEISEVILMGAGTRTPKVQELLRKAVGREELGKSLNTDEAAALGGVYQAAHLSKGFRVLKFHVKDANMFPVQVDFNRTKVDESGKPVTKSVSRTLFGRNNPFPQKKVMTFNKHVTDFSFNVNYGDLSFLSEDEIKSFGSLNLSSVGVAGVADALTKHSAETEPKGIKAHFRMDESGLLQLDLVESVFEKAPSAEDEKEEKSTLSKLGDTISNFFSGSPDDKPKDGDVQEGEENTETAEKKGDKPEPTGDKTETPKETPTTKDGSKTAPPEEKNDSKTGGDKSKSTKEKEEVKAEKTENKTETGSEKPAANTTETNTTATNATEPAEKKPAKPVVIKEELKSEITVKDLQEPAKEVMKASKKVLKEMKKKDDEKVRLEKAKNELEGYIFGTQSKLYEEDYEKCSTEEEREKLREQLAAASDWLYDQDDSTLADAYTEKLGELRKACADLDQRVYELDERPKALESLRSMLNYSTHFYKSMQNFTGEDQPFTQVEVDTLGKLLNETKIWKKKMEKDQKKLEPTEKPVLLVDDMVMKMRALDREVKYLLNKVKSFVPKTKPKSKSTNSTEENPTTPANATKPETGNETKTEEDDLKTESDDINLPPPPTEETTQNTEEKTEDEPPLELGSDQDTPEDTTDEATEASNKNHIPDDEL